MTDKADQTSFKTFSVDNSGGGDWKRLPKAGLYRLTKLPKGGRNGVILSLTPVDFSCMVQPIGKDSRSMRSSSGEGTILDRLNWRLDQGSGVTSFTVDKPVTFKADAGARFTAVIPSMPEDSYALPAWWTRFLDAVNKAVPAVQPDHLNGIAIKVMEDFRIDHEDAKQSATPSTRDAIEDRMVTMFADAMRLKLKQAREKGRGGWDRPEDCTISHLHECLMEHAKKPNLDMVDVANIAGMMWWRLNQQDSPARQADRFALLAHYGQEAAKEASRIGDVAEGRAVRLVDAILGLRLSADTVQKLDILTKLHEAEGYVSGLTSFKEDIGTRAMRLVSAMFPTEDVQLSNVGDLLDIAHDQWQQILKTFPNFRPILAGHIREVLDLAVSGITDEGLRQLDVELLVEVAKKRIILDRQQASQDFSLERMEIDRLTRDLLARIFNDGGVTARERGMVDALRQAYKKVELDAETLTILGAKADMEAEGTTPYASIASLLLAKEVTFDFSQGKPVQVYRDGDNGWPEVLGCEITLTGGLNSLSMADHIVKGRTRISSRHVTSTDPELDLTFAFISGGISQEQYLKGCMKHARKQALGVLVEDAEKEGFTRGVRTAVADLSLRMGIPDATAKQMAEELADMLGGEGRTFWTHKESGGVYLELGRGQATDDIPAGSRAVAYQAIADGGIWFRPEGMFDEAGRFERVTRQQE